MSADGFTEQVDRYLSNPKDFPPEYLWWLRRLIDDEAPASAEGGTDLETTDGTVDVDPTSKLSIGTGLVLTNPASGEAHVALSASVLVGIDFNKDNNTDVMGADASYLFLDFVGSSPMVNGVDYSGRDYGDLIYYNLDSGFGGQVIKNNGGGIIGLYNTGDGVASPYSLNAAVDGKPSPGNTGSLVAEQISSDGDGMIHLRNTGGPIVFESDGDVVFFFANGHDINSVALKASTLGRDFLIQSSQSITRNGSGVITAISPTNQAFRVRPGSTNHVWLYNLPTSSSGLTTGEVWNNSGVLNIV